MVDLETVATNHPGKIHIGNFNNAVIASGPDSRIEREVHRCMDIGRHVPGFVANVGGGLTHQIPIENLEYYLKLRKQLCQA